MTTSNIQPYEEEATTLFQKAQIDIVDPPTLEQATSTLSQLNKHLDALTEDKEKLTKPLNISLKAIREKYKPTETLLQQSIDLLRANLSAYATAQLKAKQLEEARILAREEKGTIKTETAIRKLSEIAPLETNIKTSEGSVQFRTIQKYRILDITKIPHEYLQVNDKAIKEAMEQSTPIEGIEYYSEQEVRNYR